MLRDLLESLRGVGVWALGARLLIVVAGAAAAAVVLAGTSVAVVVSGAVIALVASVAAAARPAKPATLVAGLVVVAEATAVASGPEVTLAIAVRLALGGMLLYLQHVAAALAAALPWQAHLRPSAARGLVGRTLLVLAATALVAVLVIVIALAVPTHPGLTAAVPALALAAVAVLALGPVLLLRRRDSGASR